jgi:hypothetical protein
MIAPGHYVQHRFVNRPHMLSEPSMLAPRAHGVFTRGIVIARLPHAQADVASQVFADLCMVMDSRTMRSGWVLIDEIVEVA